MNAKEALQMIGPLRLDQLTIDELAEINDAGIRALRLLAAAEANDGKHCQLIEDLRTEADLCRNETAEDIAELLDDAASSLIAAGALFNAVKDERNGLAARVAELEAAGFCLTAQSREAEEARFYRYLRDEAGQLPDDHDGPMICSGLGDNFDFLRGEECDIEIRAAIDAARSKP